MNRQGVTRLVFVFRKFVIKIPNFTCQHDHFLAGCLANYKERYYYTFWKRTGWPLYELIAPSIFCTWFGLIQIQRRVDILDRELSDDEIKMFEHVTTDIKGNNFGIYNGRLVCVDYA